MKNPKSVIFIVIIYLAFLLFIGYDVYKGVDKLQYKFGHIFKNGNP